MNGLVTTNIMFGRPKRTGAISLGIPYLFSSISVRKFRGGKIAIYVIKQVLVKSQNLKRNDFKSENLNLSSSDMTSFENPSTLSAYLSMHTNNNMINLREIPKTIAHINERRQSMKPTKSASPNLSPEPELYIGGTTSPLIVVPSLEKAKLIPKAKANSFPLNHLEHIDDYATFKDSPPSLSKSININMIPKNNSSCNH